jgi:general secretion pathway protein D
LKYLFGQTTQDHSSDETVFAITPHVIRGSEVSEINQRAIDIGTSTTISLRHANRPQAAPAQTGAPATPPANQAPTNQAPVNQAPANPSPTSQAPVNQSPAIQPSSAPAPTSQSAAPNPSAARPASFLFDPPTIQAAKGNTFVVNLLLSGAQNVHTVPVQLDYDPKLLQLVNVVNGGFLSQDGQMVTLAHREDDAKGESTITASRPSGAGGVSGQGAVVTITFQAKADGQTPLTITRGGARDPGLQQITVNGAQASVTVQQ